MSCEQKDEKFSLRFLDCDCKCCGTRQNCIPSASCPDETAQLQNFVKELSKPRYGLNCQCLCDSTSSIKSVDPCACPTTKPATTPTQVNFSIDTGIKLSSKPSATSEILAKK